MKPIQIPSAHYLQQLTNTFRPIFSDKTLQFKQFIHDILMNTYIINENTTDVNEYETLEAHLLVFYPRSPPITLELTVEHDYADYRSGDSKWGGRQSISVKLMSENNSMVPHPSPKAYGNSIRTNSPLRINHNNAFGIVSDYYISEFTSFQSLSLLTTLLILGFGERWARNALNFYK